MCRDKKGSLVPDRQDKAPVGKGFLIAYSHSVEVENFLIQGCYEIYVGIFKWELSAIQEI